MNKPLPVLLILACCTPKKQNLAVVEDSARVTETEVAAIENKNAAIEGECIFDNDYRTLTTEWLKESKVESSVWDDAKKQAVMVLDGDTLLASQGGCDHFGISLELRRASDEHAITDSTYWLNESLKLSEKFGLDFYATEIKAGNVRRVMNENGSVWYEFEDDDPEDNLYYNGIEIVSRQNSITLSISQYYN